MDGDPDLYLSQLASYLSSQPSWGRIPALKEFLSRKSKWDKNLKRTLSTLQKTSLHQPDYIIPLAQNYPELVLPILTLAADEDPAWSKSCIHLLAKLAPLHSDGKRFAQDKLCLVDCPFGDSADCKPAKRICSPPTSILESVHALLKSDQQFYSHLWNWSPLIDELSNGKQHSAYKWWVMQCLQLALGMPESQAKKLESSFDDFDGSQIKKIKLQLTDEGEETLVTSNRTGLVKAMEVISTHCPGVVSVTGVMLQTTTENPSVDMERELVMVPSTLVNLRSLAVATAAGQSVLLQGPVGCGKTALVEHLAMMTGRVGPPELLKVQLGEETDSKMLLGGYRCSELPGEFVWRAGILTQAVERGSWLILEDIDCASSDVISVLAALLETGRLAVPGYKDSLQAASTFQLFATRRLIQSSGGLQRPQLSAASVLDKLWMQVSVEPLARHELMTVIVAKFPNLSDIVAKLLDVYMIFSQGSHSSALESQPSVLKSGMDRCEDIKPPNLAGRLISTRDLLKWCERAALCYKKGNADSSLHILQDAIDIFCWAAPTNDERHRLACAAAGRLGIVSTKVDYFLREYKAHISTTPSKFNAGRAQVKCVQNLAASVKTKSVYSLTRAASCLLERVACCIERSEPVLLVGETGAGKTATIQLLAQKANRQLKVINMNQHSDSADLLGGYKPVDMKLVVSPVREEFVKLFSKTFDRSKNAKFLDHIATCFGASKWDALITLMAHSTSAALKKSLNKHDKEDWSTLESKLDKLDSQLKAGHTSLAFSFIEGTLVRAVAAGEWVLLDEINLATAETLQCLSGLLEGSQGSLHLLERGDEKPVKRHPEFRLFACMNPATDVGKKDLPSGLRNRFTEFYVDELTERSDLIQLTGCYLGGLGLTPTKLENIVKLYLKLKADSHKTLASGTGQKPHYSLRTMCRALAIAANNQCGQVARSLMEAFSLSFLTQLDKGSQEAVQKQIIQSICGKDAASIVKKPLPEPEEGKHIKVEGFWVQQGALDSQVPENYILTPTVRHHLRDLARAVSLDRAPVLLQGETSVGKTSLITYLAGITGHKCLRINNHEHTDLQEYLGQYSADIDGALTFKEGALVEAMRHGYWVILDELNLAPSDVLEALNRVLDDNRELFIPETQTLVKAHPKFMLFATQNPPGLYGGRKLLSRAFRNRFVELHFSEFPSSELETILQLRCELPASYSKKMVAVMNSLQLRRRGSAAFAGKQGFMTLRDLFRWGERYRLANTGAKNNHDWEQHLADEGYLVLAGRVRREEEAKVIEETLQKHLKCQVDPERLFGLSENSSPATKKILEEVLNAQVSGFDHIVWTFNMRRLAVLVGKAVQFKEPVLLVGETGCGKTSVCQLLAALREKLLFAVNCHLHTEAADFLGSLRPVRNHEENEGRLFEWVDGPLVQSMQGGDWFLADEISLADDSVLERLNSLLEPEQRLLLAEKGGECNVSAEPGFQFVATMNPGGDFGKKELSPALRNRLTEIWCEGCETRADRIAVAERSLRSGLSLGNQEDCTSGIGRCAADFVDWLQKTELGSRLTFSVRDLLTWIHFINKVTEDNASDQTTSIDVGSAYVHGACLTFLDSLGSGLTASASASTVRKARADAIKFLEKQVNEEVGSPIGFSPLQEKVAQVFSSKETFGLEPFYIRKGPLHGTSVAGEFLFDAPSTCTSVARILRALQLSKPVLMEGSPGVGKTSLVHALAKAAGYALTRINLSDQTDASDLFGADLPVEGGVGGQFAWRDGPFLQALKAGDWIVLDELNLASQSVLEALNACLDHRGEVFIPELGRSFKVHTKTTRLFACQNPQRQGGARRGLPKSFLNRFTEVFIESLTAADLQFIARSLFPELPEDLLKCMVAFTHRVARETADLRLWGFSGGPWEMNLRDLSRWAQAAKESSLCKIGPGGAAELVYFQRMRTDEDIKRMTEVYIEEVGSKWPLPEGQPSVCVMEDSVCFGGITLNKGTHQSNENLLLLRSAYKTLHALAVCVHQKWLSILVGKAGSGKSSAVSLLAALCGQPLKVLALNSSMDTTEILGGFEQTDFGRHLDEVSGATETLTKRVVSQLLSERRDLEAKKILQSWECYLQCTKERSEKCTTATETKLFHKKAELLCVLLKKLKRHDPDAKNLMQQVEEVACRAKEAGALNAGGRFEWVDSLLVKCLRDGSWLLVENVNMCSAAVLDRLNALLEPGGCLTLGERGVKPDGTLHTVVPHDNFRLFFTMDPRNGDISRAMRNRGVEIYTRSPDEEPESVSTLDLRALLTNCGVRFHCEQQALVTIHKTLSTGSSALDPIASFSSLLQAAALVHQNKLRGASVKEALRFACVDVFVKTRSSSDSKKQALLALNEILEQFQVEENERDLVQSQVTQSVSTIRDGSCLSRVKQEFALVHASILADDLDTQFIQILCDLDFDTIPMESFVMHQILVFCKRSSVDDWQLREDFLQHYLSKTPNIGNLIAALRTFSSFTGDSRLRLMDSNPNLCLSMDTAVAMAHDVGPEQLKFTKITTVQYSKAVSEKKLPASISNAAVLTKFYPLVLQACKMFDAIGSSSHMLTHEQCQLLNEGVRWLKHNFDFAQKTELSVQSAAQVVLSMTTHFEWVRKYLIEPLKATEMKETKEFLRLAKDVQVSIEIHPLKKLASTALPLIGKPLPFRSNEQLELKKNVESFREILKLWSLKEKKKWFKTLAWMETDKGKELRAALVSALETLHTRGDIFDDDLLKLKNCSAGFKTFEPKSKPSGTEYMAREYLCLLLISQARKMVTSEEKSEWDSLFLLENLEANSISSPELIAATALISKNLDNPSLRANFISKTLQWQSANSPLCTSPLQWLEWANSPETEQIMLNPFEMDAAAEKNMKNGRLGPDSAALTLIGTSQVFGAGSKIGDIHEHNKNNAKLSKLMWMGAQSLSDPQFDLVENEYSLVSATFVNLLAALAPKSAEKTALGEKLHDLKTSVSYPMILQVCEQVVAILEKADNRNWASIGMVWVLLGFLKLALACALSPIDPVQKKALKLKYTLEDLTETERSLFAHEIMARVCGETTKTSTTPRTLHPMVKLLTQYCEVLKSTRDRLALKVAARPEKDQYQEIKLMVAQYCKSISSSNVALQLAEKMLSVSASSGSGESILSQEETWQISQNKFCADLQKLGALYPDIVDPISAAAYEMRHGMYLLRCAVLRRPNKELALNSLLADPCCLPSIKPSRPSLLALTASTVNFAKWSASNLPNDKSKYLIHRMKMGIFEELKCQILAQAHLDEECVQLFLSELQGVSEARKAQLEEKAQKAREDQSIYKMKTTKEIEESELKVMFPMYHKEFEDFAANQVYIKMDSDPEPMQVDEKAVLEDDCQISDEEMASLGQIHEEVFVTLTRRLWLKKSALPDVKYSTLPLMNRLEILHTVLPSILTQTDSKLDTELTGTFMFALNNENENLDRPHDFYRDPLQSEAVKCHPLLKSIKSKVHELMKEWPEHPTLTTLDTLCDRILEFSSKSPVARLLCGIELVLAQLQTWEAHAHSGVSMGGHCQATSNLVLEWRRLELQRWSQALDTVQFKCEQKAVARWWCHLASLVGSEHSTMSAEKLISACQQFMEQSTLGDFSVRLRLLKAFHCQAACATESKTQTKLKNILWNAFVFYSQFSGPVATRLLNMRNPIEKKLKEAVKIARWTDTNYWALRLSVEKTHRTLFKHMRDYQDILAQNASPALNVPAVILSEWNLPMNADKFVSTIRPDKSMEETELRPNHWFKKAQRLCKELYEDCHYSENVKAVADFVAEVEDTSRLVQSQELKEIGKEKKNKERKNLLQRKRKAVADIFKSIQGLGLSYRAGITHQFKFSLESFMLEPLDISATIHEKPKHEDKALKYSWNGCTKQVSACIGRMSQLKAALTKPSSELGPNGLDKCHGFALHLMEIVLRKHSLVTKTWNELNLLEKSLLPLLSESVSPLSPIKSASIEALKVVSSASIWLAQYALLLQSYPSAEGEKQLMPGVSYPNESTVNQALSTSEALLSSLQLVKSTLADLNSGESHLISDATTRELNGCNLKLLDAAGKLLTLKSAAPNSMESTIEWLAAELKKAALLLETDPTENEACDDLQTTQLVDQVQTAALLIIQRLYHALKSRPVQEQTEEEYQNLEPGHLIERVVKPLQEDVGHLQLNEFCAQLSGIGLHLAKHPQSLQQLKPVLPLLHQVQLLAQFLMVHLTSCLNVTSRLLCQYLSLATVLVHKGYNMPAEESDEKEGDGASEQSSGMGLGEGEGEKDVSDRLESEDQLEGARQEGDEPEESADKDIPEEENGVEVSEDFEGKLQDEGKKEGEEGDDDENDKDKDDDDDAGQEMGDTGAEAEALDKEVWGSDSEEEEGDMNEADQGKGQNNDDVVPEVGAADEDGPEGTQEQKDWDAQQQQEFPEDQKDTQHGKNEAPPEPEAMDLPDDLKLDGEDGDADNEETEENPFETEELKDIKEQPEVEEKTEGAEDEKNEDSKMESEDEDEDFDGKPGMETEEGDEAENPDEKNEETAGTAQDEDAPQEPDGDKDKDEIEGQKDTEGEQQQAEAAPSKKSQDSAAQNETTMQQKDDNWGGEAGEDKGQEGVAEEDEGHASSSQKDSKMAAPAQNQVGKQEPRERKKPGKTDDSHILGDMKQPVQKKLRLADDMAKEAKEDDDEESAAEEKQPEGEGDLHQHVREAKDSTAQTMDAATQEQATEQKPMVGEEGDEPPKDDDQMDVVEEEQEEEDMSATKKELKSEKTEAPGKEGKGDKGRRDEPITDEKVDVDGDVVGTDSVSRGGACSFHTQPLEESNSKQLTPEEVQALREQLEQQLATWTTPPAGPEAFQAWSQFSAATSGLARDLCEQLRLVLEPTQAARLKGDYRTGRRINMRKVIPYIASEFRKDKIWLRRTKPSRRTYQVVLALDDSSSMADNHSKELAFESLALVSQALTLLEAGELGVVSFGEEPTVLHQLGETFNEESGARLLQQLNFNQRQTRIGKMVNFVTSMLTAASRQSNTQSDLAQLLLIVSDGRGVFSEGRELVEQAVRAAREARVFIVFLAIEDPHSKDSILDIRMPVFHAGKLQMISSYLDNFPFPYYLILRDVESLPAVLSDALRQWFELMAADVKI